MRIGNSDSNILTALGTSLFSVPTFIWGCSILHIHSVLAACQISHFEPAGTDGIFIASNPNVIMVQSHSRYERCIALSEGKQFISYHTLSSDFAYPKRYTSIQICVVKAFHTSPLHGFSNMLKWRLIISVLWVALIRILDLLRCSRTALLIRLLVFHSELGISLYNTACRV